MSDRQKLIPDLQVQECVSSLSETPNYNHQLIGIQELWKKSKGEGVKVAVLDTGTPSHKDLKLAIYSGSVIRGYEVDLNGHATHCSGIIGALENNYGTVGISPKVDMMYCAVLDKQGSGTLPGISEGIEKVCLNGAEIVSMSLGAKSGSKKDLEDLHGVIKKWDSRGVIFVAAAGNDAGSVNYPARFYEPIAVGAVDENQNLADFSCRGDEIDFVTGGVNVFSTWLDNRFARISGTSQAAPVVAGICACIQGERKRNGLPLLNSTQMNEELRKYSKTPDGSEKSKEYGYGIPVFKIERVESKSSASVWSKIVGVILGIFKCKPGT